MSCPSREERQRLIDLLQKQLRFPSTTVVSTTPYVSCRLPYRTLTRFLASLIKAGLLTRLILRDILDGSAECQRRLGFGCALMDAVGSKSTSDLSRFRRHCKVECQMTAVESGGPVHHSPQARSLYVEKELTLGVPFFLRSWSQSSSTSDSSVSDHEPHWRRHRFLSLNGSRSSSTSSDTTLFRTQSLPSVNLFASPASSDSLAVHKAQGDVSTTLGAWVSRFSFDSGLADVGAIQLRSQFRDAPHCQSAGVELSVSAPLTQVFRSTLYAHWWLKAKVSASAVKFPSGSSPPGKT